MNLFEFSPTLSCACRGCSDNGKALDQLASRHPPVIKIVQQFGNHVFHFAPTKSAKVTGGSN